MTQRAKFRLSLLSVLLLSLAAGFFDFPNVFGWTGLPVSSIEEKLPFRLGLDLQGGTHLIYEADVSQIPAGERADALAGVRDVIERRVNSFGVSEPIIQTTRAGESWRVIAELAGVHDVNQAIELIGETPLLEFREQNLDPTVELTEEQQVQMEKINTDVLDLSVSLITQLDEGADFATLAGEYSNDPGSVENGGDLGFSPRGMFAPEFEEACFDQLETGSYTTEPILTDFGYHLILKEETSGEGDSLQVRCRHILLQTLKPADMVPNNDWIYSGLTGKQLERSLVGFDPQTQAPQVNLEFNSEGAKLFEEITQRNIGRPVAIFLDGEILSTPVVQQAIANGSATISGSFTISEAKLLAQRLNAGALPVPITLISQQTVGATLGNISVQKSLQAGLMGIAAVALFMLLYYRLPGLTAVLALCMYGILTLLVFKLIGVTLTLAGIAGFILSLGMAVDANILVFERIKEELRDGRAIEHAIGRGFERAWPSIYDGNVSTLLTCLILMSFSTSLIKGFAITLALGIIVSVFSAMIITRALLNFVSQFGPLRAGVWYGVRKPKLTQEL